MPANFRMSGAEQLHASEKPSESYAAIQEEVRKERMWFT